MNLIEYLQTGVILTTPVFFVATLLILWRIVRSLDTHLEFLVYISHQVREIQKEAHEHEGDQREGSGEVS